MQCESMSCRSSVKEKEKQYPLCTSHTPSPSPPLSLFSPPAFRFGIRIQVHTDCGPMCRNAIELHEIEFAASCCRLAEPPLRGSLQ